MRLTVSTLVSRLSSCARDDFDKHPEQTEDTYGRRTDQTSEASAVCLFVTISYPDHAILPLSVLSGANVGKVILNSANPPRATGVEFRDESNTLYTVNAALEVIMATGAIKTPSILQQSGIGPRAVLQGAGVTVRVDLPVGQNLVDQITTTTTFSFSGQRGGGQVITFPRFQVSSCKCRHD